MNGTYRRFRLTACCAKSTEIMGAEQTTCSAAHFFNIQCFMCPGQLISQVRWAYFITINDITVASRHRTKARMKIEWDSLRPNHADVFWQIAVSTHHL